MGTGGVETMMKVEKGEYGYVLEDVPHLSDYIPDLPVSLSFVSLHLTLPRPYFTSHRDIIVYMFGFVTI